VKARADACRPAETGDSEAGALDPGQRSEPAVRIGGPDPVSKRGKGGKGAQAASSATAASASCSSRISARHSPNAR
jgi:hypothetical protein